MVVLTALLAMLLGAFSSLLSPLGMLGGNYYLAVELVNSTNVKEWAYNNGVAVMTLLDDTIAFFDTRGRKLYLSRECSLQRYPLLDRERAKFRAVAFASRTIELRGLEGRKAEVLRGFVEGPSVKSEKEWVRVSGTFLRAKLKFKDVGVQVRELIEALKEV